MGAIGVLTSCLVNIPQLLHEQELQEMLQIDDFLSLPLRSVHDNLDPMQTAVVWTWTSFLQLQIWYYNSPTSSDYDSSVQSQVHEQGYAKTCSHPDE